MLYLFTVCFIRSSLPSDDLIDWNSGPSVHPYVRTCIHLSIHPSFYKMFFRFRSNLVCG